MTHHHYRGLQYGWSECHIPDEDCPPFLDDIAPAHGMTRPSLTEQALFDSGIPEQIRRKVKALLDEISVQIQIATTDAVVETLTDPELVVGSPLVVNGSLVDKCKGCGELFTVTMLARGACYGCHFNERHR